MSDTKRCPRCGEEKPVTVEYFHRDKTRSDGWQCYCKECVRAYYKSNSVKLSEYMRAWRAQNLDAFRSYQRSYRKRNRDILNAKRNERRARIRESKKGNEAIARMEVQP